MQQWLNEPKNQPIIYGIAGLVMVCSIVFILFQLGIIGSPKQPYVPPSATTTAMAPVAPGEPQPPNTSPTSVRPGPAGQTEAPVASPTAMAAGPSALAAPGAPTAAIPGSTGSPDLIATVPDARKDPFAPYGGYSFAIQAAPRPRVDTLTGPLIITTYSPPVTTSTQQPPSGYGAGPYGSGPQPGGQPTVALTATLSGVMLGNGAYALVDNNGQSLVLQPGDQYPGGGILYSIESDSVTVKLDGKYVKVPITTTPTGGAGGGPGAPGAPGAPNGGNPGGDSRARGGYGGPGGGYPPSPGGG